MTNQLTAVSLERPRSPDWPRLRLTASVAFYGGVLGVATVLVDAMALNVVSTRQHHDARLLDQLA